MKFAKTLVSPALMTSLACAALAGGAAPASTETTVGTTAETATRVLLRGSTTASYFWDDGSGRNGDTGMPASGKPMQKGLFSSPSWPLGTEGYVTYKGKKARFFIGDRGPGEPSSRGIMLDIDAKTFADLTGGTFNPGTLSVAGNGGQGHIDVKYTITKWGDGPGKKNHPVPFSTGAYNVIDKNPAKPPKPAARSKRKPESQSKPRSTPKTKSSATPTSDSTVNPSGRPYINTAAREEIAQPRHWWPIPIALAAASLCALVLLRFRPRRRAAIPGRHRAP